MAARSGGNAGSVVIVLLLVLTLLTSQALSRSSAGSTASSERDRERDRERRRRRRYRNKDDGHDALLANMASGADDAATVSGPDISGMALPQPHSSSGWKGGVEPAVEAVLARHGARDDLRRVARAGLGDPISLGVARPDVPPPGIDDAKWLRVVTDARRLYRRSCLKGSPPLCGPLLSPSEVTDRRRIIARFEAQRWPLYVSRRDPKTGLTMRGGVVACAPPKVGSSSIGKFMWDLFLQRNATNLFDAHNFDDFQGQVRPFNKILRKSPRVLDIASAGGRVLRVAFVRNPFDRALSGWNEKLRHCPLKAGVAPMMKDIVRKAGWNYEERFDGGKRCLSWEEFVEALYIMSKKDPHMTDIDPHFAPQAHQCAFRDVGYDLIVPIEHGVDAGLRAIVAWLWPGRRFNKSKAMNRKVRPADPDLWTPHIRDRLSHALRDDLELLPWYKPPA